MEQYRRKPILPGVTLLSGFPEECCIYAVEGRRRPHGDPVPGRKPV